ncbi:DMT family transporter [Ancylobacter sp. 6x-1]|uniref:DMT family transporter n=1 Tax=Ancylobacter crimeensis TaxID=2579147 RepID=A0ABT0D8A8_9HYPH|nr:DMT family transporter [Ancylobacter crimeensis]MCK0196180.1 DMT family transporter [Ancylobacter crimeensis]
MTHDASPVRGILFMLAACAVFMVTDTASKLLGPHMPPTEIMAVRGMMSAALLLGVILMRGEATGLRHMRDRRVLGRGLAEAVSTLLYLSGLMSLSLADASAVFQIAPILTLAIVAALTGRRLGWRPWMAVGAGFAGVLFIIKPGAGTFTAAALFPLGSALLTSLRDFVTGRIAAHVPTLVVTLVTIVCGMAFGFAGSGFQDWRALDAASFGLLSIGAVSLVLGHMLAVSAFRSTDPAIVSPFRYATVPFALLSGVLVFGQVPDLVSIAGMTLIVAGGVFVVQGHRSERRRRAAGAPLAVKPGEA